MSISKEWYILFEQCFTPALTQTEGDLVFLSKSEWPVSLVAAHRGELLAASILQVCLCPLHSRLFPLVTSTVTDLEGAAGTAVLMQRLTGTQALVPDRVKGPWDSGAGEIPRLTGYFTRLTWPKTLRRHYQTRQGKQRLWWGHPIPQVSRLGLR